MNAPVQPASHPNTLQDTQAFCTVVFHPVRTIGAADDYAAGRFRRALHIMVEHLTLHFFTCNLLACYPATDYSHPGHPSAQPHQLGMRSPHLRERTR